jgi:hypothetical protein
LKEFIITEKANTAYLPNFISCRAAFAAGADAGIVPMDLAESGWNDFEQPPIGFLSFD